MERPPLYRGPFRLRRADQRAAAKAGKYLMICGVPGHAAAGMWDNFVVSKTVTKGKITTSK